HAGSVAGAAVRSYRTFSPLPRQSPEGAEAGGSFSVALSLRSPSPDVIRHRMSREPGLSSPAAFRPLPERPSGRLTTYAWAFVTVSSSRDRRARRLQIIYPEDVVWWRALRLDVGDTAEHRSEAMQYLLMIYQNEAEY